MCGYGDGLRRSLSNTGSVLVRGRRAPLIGRVAMDMSVVDVTDIPYVALDDEVVIIGRQRDDEIPAEEVAALSGTISYETLDRHHRPRAPRLPPRRADRRRADAGGAARRKRRRFPK